MPEDRPAPAPLPRPAPGEQSANHSPVPLPTPSTPRTPLEPMPRKVIATVAALIATATIGLVVVLWWAGTAGLSGAELVNARFNALRTGLSIGVGGGGIFALYLAWRRQHATEIGLVQKERDQADVARAYELQRETAEHARQHAERVAATTERDAEARRITDLYAKSVEQLGSDKAPVRHGGLYALERLAQDHPDNPALRQTVVNVICAYLRAPFDLPSGPPGSDADQAAYDEHRERVQEREVRLTAQRILGTHLRPGDDVGNPTSTFWPNTELDLTSAILIDWDMSHCQVHSATFRESTFVGKTSFDRSEFSDSAQFQGAIFTEDAWFNRATFTRGAIFSNATFGRAAMFSEAEFFGNAEFTEATFVGSAQFDEATFDGNAFFRSATFTKAAAFNGAIFTESAKFNKASFSDGAWFDSTKFLKDARFNEATFANDGRFEGAEFTKEARFTGATFAGDAWFNSANFIDDAWFMGTKFLDNARFSKAEFAKDALFNRAIFARKAWFGESTFARETLFNEATFTESPHFGKATFSREIQLENALLRHLPSRSSYDFMSWPSSWRPSRNHAEVEGREGTWHRLLKGADSTSDAPREQ